MTKDGGQAFPRPISTGHTMTVKGDYGMTLRDYFAGQALVGVISNVSPGDIIDISAGSKGGKFIVGASYKLADAMIAQKTK